MDLCAPADQGIRSLDLRTGALNLRDNADTDNRDQRQGADKRFPKVTYHLSRSLQLVVPTQLVNPYSTSHCVDVTAACRRPLRSRLSDAPPSRNASKETRPRDGWLSLTIGVIHVGEQARRDRIGPRQRAARHQLLDRHGPGPCSAPARPAARGNGTPCIVERPPCAAVTCGDACTGVRRRARRRC